MRELSTGSQLSPAHLAQLIDEEVGTEVSPPDQTDELSTTVPSTVVPMLTVAICTRNNPQDLAVCLKSLESIRQQESSIPFEILVVDNGSSDSRTRELVLSWPDVRYVMEPKPGLNFARNRALREAYGDIIAYLDDDVRADPSWLKGLMKSVNRHADAAGFTGLALPMELETEAQILFEKRGGFEKSFKTIRWGQTLPGHPFYPCVGGKFGTGCNMAFRRSALLELGGFDDALDTGATLPGGGDTDMLYRVVRGGYAVIYEPQMLVFHKHRREMSQLRRQYARSWGQGLMAYVAKTYMTDIPQRANLRRLVAWWFGYELNGLADSLRGQNVLPPGMILSEIGGGVLGLLGSYPRSVRRVRKIRRQYATNESATPPKVMLDSVKADSTGV
jgi:glycosyltransferase involved in cell wall biosynthesis